MIDERNLTPAVARAIQLAKGVADSLQFDAVAPAHLLFTILEEEEGLAALCLAKAGLEARTCREALGFPATSTPSHPSKRTLGPDVEAALLQAKLWSGESSEDQAIRSDHLLLALLRAAPALASRLESLGLELRLLDGLVRGRDELPLRLDEPLELPAVTESVDVHRILDAEANRAREALRVIEDYCRFALADRFLAAELKQIRHELTAALSDLAPQALCLARDTIGDVGTDIKTAAEHERRSPEHVALVNCKRLQESLRSLEEYGKLLGPHRGRPFESLRYRGYTLEKALLAGGAARRRLADAKLYVLLTGSECLAALDWTIEEAAAGGADVFQLREKQLSDRELLERAKKVRRWTRKAGALFIVNDRPDIARLAEADGVHVGQEELPLHEVRRIVGTDMLVGVSTHNLEQVHRAIRDGASYIGVGPTFPGQTKAFDYYPGLDFVRAVSEETSLPAFAIGGIDSRNIHAVVQAGARRVAVSRAICASEDPRSAARLLRSALGP